MGDLFRLDKDAFTFLNKFFGENNKRLAQGDHAPAAIAGLQQFLRGQGLYAMSVDGIYGKGTKAAVSEYQRRNGIEPTGVVDENTFYHIVRARGAESAAKQDPQEIERGLDVQRGVAILQVENAVNEQAGAVMKPGVMQFFHNFGVLAGITTHEVPPEVKAALLQRDKASVEGVEVNFSPEIMTNPVKLREEMQKLAQLCSGGAEITHDFADDAAHIASVSRHVETNGPIKAQDLLIKKPPSR